MTDQDLTRLSVEELVARAKGDMRHFEEYTLDKLVEMAIGCNGKHRPICCDAANSAVVELFLRASRVHSLELEREEMREALRADQNDVREGELPSFARHVRACADRNAELTTRILPFLGDGDVEEDCVECLDRLLTELRAYRSRSITSDTKKDEANG